MAKIKVLVVEDEYLIRMDLVDSLLDEGFEVLAADNADDAIAILESDDQIQVMFTDIDMPGSMNGLILSSAVRDRWPPIKIVVTSGQRVRPSATDLPEGSLFFAKPYDHSKVAASFRAMLAA